MLKMRYRPACSILFIFLITAAVRGVRFSAPDGIYSYSFPATVPAQGSNPPTGDILQVECTDNNGNALDSVTYSIVDGNSDPFWLNETTGQLSWRPGQVLDYENTTIYMFSIICVDSLDQNDTAMVIISVTPVTAEIRSVVNVALLELTEVGTQVTAVTCPESYRVPGPYAGIAIQTVSPSQFDASFELDTMNNTNSGSRALILQQPLDYEALQPQQVVNVTLTCFDSQSPPNMVSFDVIISVLPVNDVPPQFNQTQYEFTIDIASGMERICCVLATDGDRDVGGNVTYSLFDAQGRFSIQDNGEITFVLSTLTDKVGTTFVVQVTASDGELSSTVPATISVIERPRSFGITAIIIVAVCGAAVLLIIVILLICCCCIRYYTTDSWTKRKEPVKDEKPKPLLPMEKKTRASSSQVKKVIKLEEMA